MESGDRLSADITDEQSTSAHIQMLTLGIVHFISLIINTALSPYRFHITFQSDTYPLAANLFAILIMLCMPVGQEKLSIPFAGTLVWLVIGCTYVYCLILLVRECMGLFYLTG